MARLPLAGARLALASLYEETEAGKVIQAARRALRDQEAPQPLWFYMAPAVRGPDA